MKVLILPQHLPSLFDYIKPTCPAEKPLHLGVLLCLSLNLYFKSILLSISISYHIACSLKTTNDSDCWKFLPVLFFHVLVPLFYEQFRIMGCHFYGCTSHALMAQNLPNTLEFLVITPRICHFPSIARIWGHDLLFSL